MGTVTMSQIAPMNIHYVLYPLDYFLDKLVSLELQAVELWGGSPHVPIEDLKLSDVSRLRRGIEARGLTVACFTPETCVYPINLAAEDEALRRRSIAYALKSLDIASELGTDLMQIVAGRGYYDKPTDDAWKRSRDAIELIARKAETLGIRLTMEPLLYHESNLVHNLQTAKRMMQEIGSPHLGCNVDTVPMVVAGDSLEAYFTELAGCVNHIHLCDGSPQGHVPLGSGNLPIASFLKELGDRGYQGYIGLETCGVKHYLEPDRHLEQSIGTIRKALSLHGQEGRKV